MVPVHVFPVTLLVITLCCASPVLDSVFGAVPFYILLFFIVVLVHCMARFIPLNFRCKIWR